MFFPLHLCVKKAKKKINKHLQYRWNREHKLLLIAQLEVLQAEEDNLLI